MKQLFLLCLLGLLMFPTLESTAMMGGHGSYGSYFGGNMGGGRGWDTREGSSRMSDTSMPQTGTIIGTIRKGPVAKAAVKAFSINRYGTKGGLIGLGRTDEQGNFSMPVGDYSSPVLIEITGGDYMVEATDSKMMDQATDFKMDVPPENVMTAAMPFVKHGYGFNGVQVTALTSMAQKMAETMSGGKTEANIIHKLCVGGLFHSSIIYFSCQYHILLLADHTFLIHFELPETRDCTEIPYE